MKIWMNTKTLDGYIDGLDITESPDEAEVVLLGSKPIDIGDFPNLRGIFRAGMGRENVPLDEAEKRGVAVGFPQQKTAEIIYDETSAFTCAMILRMAYREVGTFSPWVKRDRPALKDLTLLIIGAGNIGSRVYSLMEPFLNVMIYDAVDNTLDELRGLIEDADIVTIHIPYTQENHEFIDFEKLGWMKDGAALVNTARGGIVCEDALYKEIEKGRITAAFDVYWKEPYEGRLKEFYPERFFMTPHVASTCSSFLEETAKDFIKFMKEIGG